VLLRRIYVSERLCHFTTAFDAVLASAGIRTVLCNIQRTVQLC
jgi:hypothetical protein